MTTIYNTFKRKHILTLSPPDIGTNNQAYIAGTQQSNREKEDDIGCIAKASISKIEMEEVRTTDPMLILRDKGRCRASRNLLIRAAAYETVRSRTILPLHQIKTVKMQMKR